MFLNKSIKLQYINAVLPPSLFSFSDGNSLASSSGSFDPRSTTTFQTTIYGAFFPLTPNDLVLAGVPEYYFKGISTVKRLRMAGLEASFSNLVLQLQWACSIFCPLFFSVFIPPYSCLFQKGTSCFLFAMSMASCIQLPLHLHSSSNTSFSAFFLHMAEKTICRHLQIPEAIKESVFSVPLLCMLSGLDLLPKICKEHAE